MESLARGSNPESLISSQIHYHYVNEVSTQHSQQYEAAAKWLFIGKVMPIPRADRERGHVTLAQR